MKTCARIRPVLLTDYIDNELDDNAREEINKHLSACPECRKLVTGVKEDMAIFSGKPGLREKAPQHLWQAVVKRIEEEKYVRSGVADFVRGLRDRFVFRPLVPAIVAAALLVLSISFFLYAQSINRLSNNGMYEYTADILGGREFSAEKENEGLGTSIEKYFL